MGKQYDQLDIDERYELYRLHEAGKGVREIGRLMGRSVSTISRELQRNVLPRGGYKPGSADRMALSRRRRLSRIERLSPLRAYVGDRLAMGWSPEQIEGRLRLERSEHTVCVETIYRFIYRPAVRREKLHRFLPRAKASRGRRYFTTADSNHIAPLARSVPVASKRGFVGSTAAWQPVSAESLYPAIEFARPRSREGTRSA